VARLRKAGHSLSQLRAAAHSGRLAYGYLEDLFPPSPPTRTMEQAAEETGLEPALIERIWSAAGFSPGSLEQLSDDDVELLKGLAAVLHAGLPLVAFLQLVRVYGQALAQIADAEVKLFHLYVHEPLIRDGVEGLDIAEELADLASELLPLSAPIMDQVHQRLLQHFIAQDIVGHLESVGEEDGRLGRVRVAIAFADLAGYTRLTEELGEEEALEVVERFVGAVEDSLPDDARVIKTIGDEVMVVGSDASALVDWAVGFQELAVERPLPRIGIHAGPALYRDGDYYGRAVNLASRVGARAAGGEVLVTRQVVRSAGRHLAFQHIGEVKLKGFDEATELFLARPRGKP
jgi:adenylate cyclase